MSDVYLAAACGPDGFSKLLVAKVLKDELRKNDQFVQMFRDEARLSARLNHPNIVQTYEVSERPDCHFMAMEYLEGQPLDRVAKNFERHRHWGVPLALRVVIDALAGLQYAHDLRGFDGKPLGVVHRDITPQNIFVTYEGQIKLVDFGIAKTFESTVETQAGVVKGKISYMAPEQARGELVGVTADLFSIGVVLWELLSGTRLWSGLTEVAVVGQLALGKLPDLALVRPDISPSLVSTVMRALSADPALRPQSARILQQELEEEFEELTTGLSTRQLGELMRSEFGNERSAGRAIVARQLEALRGRIDKNRLENRKWDFQPSELKQLPILGDTHQIHNDITTIHTSIASRQVATAQSAETVRPGGATASRARRAFYWTSLSLVAVASLVVIISMLDSSGFFSLAAEREIRTVDLSQPVASRSVTQATSTEVALPRGCDSPTKPTVELTGEIDGDASLTCDKNYLLRFTTYVTPGSSLTIQAGTTILGDLQTKGALVVQPGARINAVGTPTHPIVFTSAAASGTRKAGDWGGVILLGESTLNLKDAQGNPSTGKVEGITAGGEYGGNSVNDSSGVLSYVRIEYSGTEIAPNNEINGLTLAGVGRGTVIDHVQVRHTADDCFEFFGGTVDAKYLVCQSPGDDAFDWDYGYTGRLQFLVAQSSPKASSGSHGLEGDNDPNGSKNRPISSPKIYNISLCGKNRSLEHREHYGVLLRRGSAIRLRNALVSGYSAGLDVRDTNTRPNIAASVFFGNVVHNLAFPESSLAFKSERLLYDDDSGFDERNYLENPGLRIGTADPVLENCFDGTAMRFKPLRALVENAAIAPNDGFFDSDAIYIGAFRDRNDNWDEGNWLKWGQ